MSLVREFNPPARGSRGSRGGRSGRYSTPTPPSGIYRPSFAVGRDASDIVRERLRSLKIGKPAKGGRVLLNKSHRSNLTAEEAGEAAGRGARRAGSFLARAGSAIGRGAVSAAHGAAAFARGAAAGAKANSAAVAALPKKRRAKKAAAAKKPAASQVKKPSKRKPAAKMVKGVAKACAKKGIKIPTKKAQQILKDGSIRGKPLTKQQRGLMGLVAGGCKTPKGAAAKKRAAKLDAERKAAEKAKHKRKAKKSAKTKPKAKKPKMATKPKAKKPTKAKTAKKPKPRRWKGSVKAELALTSTSSSREIVPTKKSTKRSKKSQVPAASAVTAKASPAKAKKSTTRRKTQVAKKKRAGHKKAKAKKKNQGAVRVSNKPKKHKAKKANKKHKAKKNQGAVRVSNKPKHKKHNKHRKNHGRRNSPEKTELLKQLLDGQDLQAVVKRTVAAEQGQRAMQAFNKKIDAVLNRLTKLGYNDRPKMEAARETLADILRKAGIGAGHARVTRPKKRKPAATAVTEPKKTKKKAKKAKAKKHNKHHKHKAKKANKSKKHKAKKGGSKKKAKAKKGSSKKKHKAKKGGSKKPKSKKKHHPALAGSLQGSVELHEVRRNKKGKRKNSGAVLAMNGVNDTVSDVLNKVPVAGAVLGPLWDNKGGLVGLTVGAAGAHAMTSLVLPSFASQGVWQSLLSTALGGLAGIGATAFLSPMIAPIYCEEDEVQDEVKRQVAFASVGALGALVSSAFIKFVASDPTNPLRVLNGTDATSLSDYVGLGQTAATGSTAPASTGASTSGSSGSTTVAPGTVTPAAAGSLTAPANGNGRHHGPTQQMVCPPADGSTASADDNWSSALDYGDAKFDPLGYEPDEYSDSSMMDFAEPAMGDFAEPAMGDFAEPAMGDFAEPAMGDFAEPA